MKSILFLFLLLSFYSCSNNSKTTAPNQENEFWGHRYSEATNVKYGDAEDQRMDIYSQGEWIGEPQYWKGDTAKHPTLVYIHGGGWLGGSKDHITPFILPYLQKGWNVVNLEYRTGEGTAPQAVDDCMMALQWIARNASDYNINTQQIVVSGESAGGHLALITGLLNSIQASHKYYSGDSLKIISIVNWFGIADIAGIDTFYSQKNEPDNYASIWVGNAARMDSISAAFSPLNKITPTAPPIITIHGKKDSVVPFEQAVKLHELLKKEGIKNELVAVDDGKHLGFTDKEFQHIYTRIFDFLKQK
jgi:acetyl esterase/lipase